MELGKVADVYRAGETEVYVVRGGTVGEFDLASVRDVITTFAPERGELIVDESVLDLAGPVVEAPERTAQPRRRHRWSRHGKGARAAGSGPESPEAGSATAGADEPEAGSATAGADEPEGGSNDSRLTESDSTAGGRA